MVLYNSQINMAEHSNTGAQEPEDYGSRSESDDGSVEPDASEGEPSTPKPKKPRKAGAATYKTEFKFPFITSVQGDPFRFRCNICDKKIKKIKCDHMGKQDIEKHCKTQGHQDKAKSLKSQSKLRFNAPQSSETVKRTEAELGMAVLTATSNIPLAFHDRLSPTIRNIFPDSKIASNYHSASTKATCMLNFAVAPALLDDLVGSMKIHPFSISIDGSNDTGLQKMNPTTVRIYDVDRNKVVTRFLDMCTSTTATAEGIYGALDSKLVQFLGCANPWSMCTSIGVDNTSVNIGIRDSLMTRILQCNPAIYFNGCACHIIHNAAQKAGDAFTECWAFDVEELTIDLYYWFDKSTKRKSGLRSYCTFCDQEYRAIIKHVTTRWLQGPS